MQAYPAMETIQKFFHISQKANVFPATVSSTTLIILLVHDLEFILILNPSVKVHDEIAELKQDLDSMNRNFELKGLIIAHDAEFDSYTNIHDECLPGTRTEVLDEIEEWATAPGKKIISCIQGMTGTGKSTIAKTVTARFKKKGHLGASFFKRGDEDQSELLPHIQTIINEDPRISDKTLTEQFSGLY